MEPVNAMTGADLYQNLKDSLKFFGLSFHQMDQIAVWPTEDGKGIKLVHGRVEVTFPMLEE